MAILGETKTLKIFKTLPHHEKDIYTFRYSGNDILVCCMPEGGFFSGN